MVVSASILDQLHNYYIVLLTSVVVMCFTAASNALNDAIDIKSDSINRPNRPISLGRVSINSAIFISFGLYTAGSIICLNLPNMAQVIAIIISVPLMIIYILWSIVQWMVDHDRLSEKSSFKSSNTSSQNE